MSDPLDDAKHAEISGCFHLQIIDDVNDAFNGVGDLNRFLLLGAVRHKAGQRDDAAITIYVDIAGGHDAVLGIPGFYSGAEACVISHPRRLSN